MKSEKKHLPLRTIIQASFAVISNGYAKGFVSGRIYDGRLKYVCVPGMNCYSCPGALGSCPIGSLQSSLTSKSFSAFLYVSGFLFLFGSVLGRAVCGFLCPFGLIQDLLYKIPLKVTSRIPFLKKLRKLPGERFLRFLRFFFLFVFVLLLPLFVIDITGLGEPWFCKFICPVGTLEAGVPLALLNSFLRSSLGFLYAWKVLILVIMLLFSVIIYRPFCRYVCPLGALYGLFNKISLYRFSVDKEACTECGACQKKCRLDIAVYKNPNSIDCVRCGDCRAACPHNAIKIF